MTYPAFQFVEDDAGLLVVAPAWTCLAALAREAHWSDLDLVLWAGSPNAWLEGRTPADEVQAHPDGVAPDLAAPRIEALLGEPVLLVFPARIQATDEIYDWPSE